MEVQNSEYVSEEDNQLEEQALAETLEKRYKSTEDSQRVKKQNPPKTMRGSKKNAK